MMTRSFGYPESIPQWMEDSAQSRYVYILELRTQNNNE